MESGGLSMQTVMKSESPNDAGSGLPFKEPVQAASAAADPIPMPSEPGQISRQADGDEREEPAEANLQQLLNYLRQGLESLKGLNLQGFQQIYPVVLSIFGAVIAALMLVIVANLLQSIHQLPLIGGVLSGIFELCGVVALTRFTVSNLLLQQKRADVFVRIAQLKKELIGE